ncbi:hypothetical protein F4802DRAFT_595247 [Xylaria palmicola]|nr:hypothetical protein F4802DRAFT_595247 [Xylaria palmicola]
MAMQPNSPPHTEDSTGRQKPPRRLACRRCNRQKLQCRWEEESDQACTRCQRESAVCTSSTPRRLGRPTGRTREAHEPVTSSSNQLRWERQETQSLSNTRESSRPKLPTGDVLTQYFYSCEALSPSIQGSTPRSRHSASSLLSSDETQEFNNSPPNDNDIWPFMGLGITASVSNAVPGSNPASTDFTLFTIPQETSMGYSETSEYQGMFDSSGNLTSEVSQVEFMQELWDLQLLLQDQLRQIRIGVKTGCESIVDGDTNEHRRRCPGITFPVDEVLTSTQRFVDLLKKTELRRRSSRCRKCGRSRRRYAPETAE